jgi:hypothetical protein
LLEQIHRIYPTLRRQLSVGRTSNNVLSTINITEEKEPPKPPPDEDEANPPIKEPPTEEPPVKEPPPKNRSSAWRARQVNSYDGVHLLEAAQAFVIRTLWQR